MPPELSVSPNVPHGSYAKHLVLIGILVLILLGVGAWQFYFNDADEEETHEEFFSTLLNQNRSLAEAEGLALENRYVESIPLYIQALQQARNNEERTQIQLLAARSMVLVGQYATAVPLLKEIVASEENPRTVRARALAITEIAKIYARGEIEVNRDIFEDEPF